LVNKECRFLPWASYDGHTTALVGTNCCIEKFRAPRFDREGARKQRVFTI
jgi:hypothetical protein